MTLHLTISDQNRPYLCFQRLKERVKKMSSQMKHDEEKRKSLQVAYETDGSLDTFVTKAEVDSYMSSALMIKALFT